jgi:hypothetical protein
MLEFERRIRQEVTPQPHSLLLQGHPEFEYLTSPTVPAGPPKTTTPKGTSKIFRFSAAGLNFAKARLGSFINPENLTSNAIISALVWSVITCIRFSRFKISPTVRPKLGFAINGRKHLGDEFFGGAVYFGNVNLIGIATVDFADICNASASSSILDEHAEGARGLEKLVPVIDAITTAISRICDFHIAEVIQIIEAVSDVSLITQGWSSRNGPDLTSTSWANMGVYECDFGDEVGFPEVIRVPYAEFDGLVIILPRRRKVEDEVIEAVVMLGEEDMDALKRNNVWTLWTT